MKLKELAAKLISFNTISNESTVPMADFISEYLEKCGFEIERYPYENQDKVKKINLIARKGGADSRLVLSGHMDTVPAGGLGWKSDPFLLTDERVRVNGKKNISVCRGLGISDMKFFLAVAMKAGEAISAEELRHPLALCFTSDEEVGCLGAKKLVEAVKLVNKNIGRYVVIGEPTESRPIYAHKGYIFLEVYVEARKGDHPADGDEDNPVHSSNTTTTTNVVEKTLSTVLDELYKFKQKIEVVRDERFYPEYPTMNIGGVIRIGKKGDAEKSSSKDKKIERLMVRIRGEFSPGRRQSDVKKSVIKAAKNIIPRGYTIESDIRPLPGQDPVDFIEIIKANIEERISCIKPTVSSEEIKVRVGCAERRAPTHPMETSRESLIVKAAEDISGYTAGTASYNTEGNIFNKAGSETVIWGPTNILQAHQDNEYILADLFKDETVEKYIRLIRRICAEGGG